MEENNSRALIIKPTYKLPVIQLHFKNKRCRILMIITITIKIMIIIIMIIVIYLH